MGSKKKILVAPLDWGLGHATRCIPIINYLLNKNVDVIFGADKGPLELLRLEFPTLPYIVMPGYEIKYPKSGNMAWQMLLSSGKILKKIKQEQEQLQDIIKSHNIDAVISDNRYGLYSTTVPCVFITHQLQIKTPKWGGELIDIVVNKINQTYINRYNQCWVPDIEGPTNLSGELGHPNNLPNHAKYIGLLSRFKKSNETKTNNKLLAILSGPEPQRSIFEDILIQQLNTLTYPSVLVRGIADDEPQIKPEAHVQVMRHLPAAQLQKLIERSELIVSRPGYSTLMDLAALGKKGIFIPTPGQTEQEYLGKQLVKKGIAYSCPQDEFNLTKAIELCSNYKGLSGYESRFELYNTTIDEFLAQF